MNKYIEYAEKSLHMKVASAATEQARTDTDDLPLYLAKGYGLSFWQTCGVAWLLAEPADTQNLSAIRKQAAQLRKLCGLPCVIGLEKLNAYSKAKMIEESIPFIVPGRHIYMPFLGVALTGADDREPKHAEKLSYPAQRMLLAAIYGNWRDVLMSEAAERLGVTKMTVTRYFDEIEAVGAASEWQTNMPRIETHGKTRRFIWDGGQRELWGAISPFLDSPVSKRYRLDATISDIGGISGTGGIDGADGSVNLRLGGLSAISHYSMLGDNQYPIYAVSKATAKQLALDTYQTVPREETPALEIQVLRYEPFPTDNAAIDPLTAILSLTEAEKQDPRIEAAIEQILGEFLNG